MTHKLSRISILLISLLFISQLQFLSTNAGTHIIQNSLATEQPADLLIFLSPQYLHDTHIKTALSSYATVIEQELWWKTKLILIQEHENDYHHIDSIIETHYQTHPLKACIMVGEDLNTPLGGDADYLEQPSILPWSTLGGTNAYELSEHGIICKPTPIDICISLIYPTSELPYEQKKNNIITAFHKFTTQRYSDPQHMIQVFESSCLNTNSQALYQQLSTYGPLTYLQDATDEQITASLTTPYSAFFVHGHSSPAGTDVNNQQNSGWFSSEYLDSLATPFFGADGCYVGGWWSNQKDNNKLDPSVNAHWYGSKIFTSPSIRVMALGFLSQNGYSTPVSFLENVFPKLMSGETLAEAMIGETFIGDLIIVGDPTFHYAI